MTKRFLALLLLAGLQALHSAEAKLYKWVDDKGVTHYGEIVPPEYANKTRSQLSAEGRVVGTNTVLSPDQKRQQEEYLKQQKEEERAQQEQRRRDAALLSSFSSISEIDASKARSLQQIDATIKGIQAQIKINQSKLAILQAEENDYKSKNTAAPTSLRDDLRDTANRVLVKRAQLDKALQERAGIEARFEADKARYRQLTGAQ